MAELEPEDERVALAGYDLRQAQQVAVKLIEIGDAMCSAVEARDSRAATEAALDWHALRGEWAWAT